MPGLVIKVRGENFCGIDSGQPCPNSIKIDLTMTRECKKEMGTKCRDI